MKIGVLPIAAVLVSNSFTAEAADPKAAMPPVDRGMYASLLDDPLRSVPDPRSAPEIAEKVRAAARCVLESPNSSPYLYDILLPSDFVEMILPMSGDRSLQVTNFRDDIDVASSKTNDGMRFQFWRNGKLYKLRDDGLNGTPDAEVAMPATMTFLVEHQDVVYPASEEEIRMIVEEYFKALNDALAECAETVHTNS